MSKQNQLAFQQALRDFRSARDRAMLETVLDRLKGQPSHLLSYEEVRKKLSASGSSSQGLKEIPLDAIIGSVGRYTDFTRSFLPREQSDEQRWARVKALAEGLEGLPPIEVYQIGNAYFVRDGHHRVSVARELGAKAIEAYVTEVKSRVPLSKTDDPSQLIIKEEYAHFLKATGLDYVRPEADIELTEAGRYPQLQARIDLHYQHLQDQSEEPIEYQQAVADWYDRVYLPVVRVIRRQGILREFPERTEADLYLWMMDHCRELEQHLGWQVGVDQVAADLAEHHSERTSRRVEQLGERLLEAIIPDDLEAGPPAGDWRRKVVARREDSTLFRDILVAIRDDEAGWRALDQGIYLAAQENSRVLGLHVASHEHSFIKGKPDQLAARFEARCLEAGVRARFVIDRGRVTDVISRRARWTDLVILSLMHPPAIDRLARLGSGLRRLIRSCPRPILLLPDQAQRPERVLITYDGSPKSQEALYIGAYTASAWGAQLKVISVHEEDIEVGQLDGQIRDYFESKDLSFAMHIGEGEAAEAILEAAADWSANMLLIGGYGASPVLEVVLGSTVDEVLRRTRIPVIVCR